MKSGVSNYFESSKSSSLPNIVQNHHCRKKFTYKRIPVYDSATSDLLSHAPTVVSFISTALHHGSVLVHCQRGISRSTTAVLFYLMGGAGLTLQEGMDLCKRRRPEVDPIPAFMQQLKTYESRCRKMGMLQSKDSIPKSKDSVDFKGKGKGKGVKRTAGEQTIGPARGPPRPIGPVLGPPKGPTKNAIIPTSNSIKIKNNGGQKNDKDYEDSHKSTNLFIGQSLSSYPCADGDENTRLLEQHETRAKGAAISPLRKPSTPSILIDQKKKEKSNVNKVLEVGDKRCCNDDAAATSNLSDKHV